MSLRILMITTLYPDYLRIYYKRFPEIRHKSYVVQYEHLLEDSIGFATSYSRMLNKLGHETVCVITNAHILQGTWAQENNIDGDRTTVLNAQIKAFEPDILWIDDVKVITHVWITDIKSSVPAVKLLMGYYCTTPNESNLYKLKQLDFVLTCTPGLMTQLRTHGVNAYLVYHCFDPAVLKKVDKEIGLPGIDIVFSGMLQVGGEAHNTRLEIVEALLREGVPLQIYSDLESSNLIRLKQLFFLTMKFVRKCGLNNLVKSIPIVNKREEYALNPVKSYSAHLKKISHPAVYGYEMFGLLRNSKITLNIHGDVAKEFAGNMRLFEATGVGSCLVTDSKKNLPELFEHDREVITYRNVDECIEKVKWLLNHEQERSAIALNGQKRTLRSHTIEDRCAMIIEIFMKELNK